MSSGKSFSQSSLEFLVENAIYPMWSKKEEVYFRAKKGVLTPEKKKELVEELNLRTKAEKLPFIKAVGDNPADGERGNERRGIGEEIAQSFRELKGIGFRPRLRALQD